MGLIIAILVVLLMLALNGFFVAAEFAAVSASKPKIEGQADDGDRNARYLHRTISDEGRMDRYIAAAQVGITATSLVVGFYGQRALAPYVEPLLSPVLPQSVQVAAVTAPILLITLSVLQVIFAELFPKSIAVRAPERVAVMTARPMRWSLAVLGPFIWLLNGSALWVLRRLGLDKPAETGDEHSGDELRAIIAESLDGGTLEEASHEMLAQVLSFQERVLREVMEPRTRMQTLPPDMPAKHALRHALSTGYTRFPVVDTARDERPVGLAHIRELHDLATSRPDAPVREVAGDILLMPDSLSLAEAWSRLQKEQALLAVVFNEFGILSGLVTVEDLIEEIIGEVEDEFDDEQPRMEERDGRVFLRGDLTVEEVNRHYGLGLDEAEADTISGLVALNLGVADPSKGAEIDVGGTAFRVEEVENGFPRRLSFDAARAADPSDTQAEDAA